MKDTIQLNITPEEMRMIFYALGIVQGQLNREHATRSFDAFFALDIKLQGQVEPGEGGVPAANLAIPCDAF